MSPLDSPATVLTNVPIDVTDKIERVFTWIGESEWDNRRARPLKRFRWSELRSVSRILPIRPRLPHGTFVGDVLIENNRHSGTVDILSRWSGNPPQQPCTL